MLFKVDPLASFSGTYRVPPSKPETQRAILAGSLAKGTSRVFNDLRCGETATMKEACRSLGATIVERDDHLEIHGGGGSRLPVTQVMNAAGSGLVFRTLAAIASVQASPVVVTGDAVLCKRVMAPLFDALRELGADINSICDEGCAPIVNWGRGLRGGKCRLPGDVSSQFITAILYAAPFADAPVEIEVTGELYSRSYVQQTVLALARAGIDVTMSDDGRHLRVEPGAYRPHDTRITEDYTSASYLLAASALYPGRSVFTNVYSGSAQGEAAIVNILERFGLRTSHDSATRTLVVDNDDGVLRGDFEIDASDCPNIVPTLAAIGAYVRGTLRVVGGGLPRFHKAPRIEAMVTELRRAGVDIAAVNRQGVCDGFEVRGQPTYDGGSVFASWGDHRVFMSLFVASLRMKSTSYLSGFNDTSLSFPEFFGEFGKAGVKTSVEARDSQPSSARHAVASMSG